MIKNILIIVAVIIVIVIAFVVINNMKSKNPSSDSALSSSSGNVTTTRSSTASQTEVENFSNELLRLLGSLENLTLNDSLFFNPAFDQLTDITIPLRKEGNQGRRNPFSPIGTFESATQAVSAETDDSVTVSGETNISIPSLNQSTTGSSSSSGGVDGIFQSLNPGANNAN